MIYIFGWAKKHPKMSMALQPLRPLNWMTNLGEVPYNIEKFKIMNQAYSDLISRVESSICQVSTYLIELPDIYLIFEEKGNGKKKTMFLNAY